MSIWRLAACASGEISEGPWKAVLTWKASATAEAFTRPVIPPVCTHIEPQIVEPVLLKRREAFLDGRVQLTHSDGSGCPLANDLQSALVERFDGILEKKRSKGSSFLAAAAAWIGVRR